MLEVGDGVQKIAGILEADFQFLLDLKDLSIRLFLTYSAPHPTLLVLRRDKLENTRQREIRVKNKETNYGEGGEDMKALIRKREGEIGLQKKFQKEEIKRNWREAEFRVR